MAAQDKSPFVDLPTPVATSDRPIHPYPIAQFIGIAMLAWALVPSNPYGYYILLRFVIFGICVFLALRAVDLQKSGWAWALGVAAVIYNPIIRVHSTREIWSIVNLGTIVLLVVTIAALRGISREQRANAQAKSDAPSPGSEDSEIETVLYHDVEARKTVRMPASELRPGCVRVQIHGTDEIVWVSADQIREGPLRHPPFDKSTSTTIRVIQAALAEVRPMSFEEWEEGFRRDMHPHREIALWAHAAGVYLSCAKERSAAERADIFGVIVSCLTTSPETVWRTIDASVLSKAEIGEVINRFYKRAA